MECDFELEEVVGKKDRRVKREPHEPSSKSVVQSRWRSQHARCL